jgi:hypothetical protein
MYKLQKKDSEHFTIKGDWNKQSKALKVKFPKLTEPDLKFEAGKENELITRIESRLNKKRPEVITLLKSLNVAKD